MIIPSFFGEYANSPSLQALIDGTLETLQVKSMWRQFLDEDLPQASLSFEQVIGRARIEAAGSIVGIDDPAPLRSNNKMEKYYGAIPSVKEAFTMSQSELRDLMAMEESQLLAGNANIQALIKKLYNHVELAATAGDKRMDILLMQALSTLTLDVSVTNNPDGAALGVINLLPKDYQIQGVPKVWTDPTADAIADIENFADYIADNFGRGFGNITMSKRKFRSFKRLPKVVDQLKSFFNIGKTNGTYAPTLANVNEMFDENGWPMIRIVDDVIGIETDGDIQAYRFWKDDNISFMPNGKIGTLKNAFAMESRKPVAGKAYANYGPTLVMKYAEDRPYKEFTEMEMNACPAVNTDAIFILTTDVVQAEFTGGTIQDAD